jgi:hypothetical protein
VYLFTHKGSASLSEMSQGGREKFHGTSHGDDLLYLFPWHKYVPDFFNARPSEEDRKLTRIMTRLWVNFATAG